MPTMALIECGSNSLKLHYHSRTTGDFHSMSLPWQLGHDVYQTGRLSEETLDQAVSMVEELLRKGFDRKSLMAIATEGLRDAENRDVLLKQLRDRLNLEVRVISGREEASLLAEGYVRLRRTIPAYLVDIGGGSLQLVRISDEKTVLRDSLPLGAIRLYYLGEEDGKRWNKTFVEEYIRNTFEDACLMQMPEIHATGGTMKALAHVLNKKTFVPDEVDKTLADVEREGPPASLKPERQRVFLPGLLVLSHLLRSCATVTVHYLKIPVGRIFLERILDRLGLLSDGRGKTVLFNQMRITNIRSKLT